VRLVMMSESVGGPPAQIKPHTTVSVITDPGPAPASLEIRLNIGYFKTLQGIIKLVELVLGIVCMACASPAGRYSLDGQILRGEGQNHWFLFVVVTSFIITLLWSFYYLLQLRDFIRVKLPFKFMTVEVIYTVIATILYFIAFIVILEGFGSCAGLRLCDARIAGGVFGLFNTVAYGIGAYLIYSEYSSTPPELR